jgi:hypothetical protein
VNGRDLIEALRGETTPDGWDPTSGGAYCRELWVGSADEALQLNRRLGLSPDELRDELRRHARALVAGVEPKDIAVALETMANDIDKGSA